MQKEAKQCKPNQSYINESVNNVNLEIQFSAVMPVSSRHGH